MLSLKNNNQSIKNKIRKHNAASCESKGSNIIVNVQNKHISHKPQNKYFSGAVSLQEFGMVEEDNTLVTDWGAILHIEHVEWQK